MVMTSSGQEQIAFDTVQTNGEVYLPIPIPKRVSLGEVTGISSTEDQE
jgi:hypothetical protein